MFFNPTNQGRPLILLLPGNYAAHAAARVGGVSVVARDDVAMEVHHGLARGLAAVHANVVAVRLVALFDPRSGLGDGIGQGRLLFRRQLKPIRTQPVRNEQHVPQRHRKPIGDRKEMRGAKQHLLFGQVEEHAHEAEVCAPVGRMNWKPLLEAMETSGSMTFRRRR